jgi:hypothetical protein
LLKASSPTAFLIIFRCHSLLFKGHFMYTKNGTFYYTATIIS